MTGVAISTNKPDFEDPGRRGSALTAERLRAGDEGEPAPP